MKTALKAGPHVKRRAALQAPHRDGTTRSSCTILTSTTGVPSIASIGPIRRRLPSISSHSDPMQAHRIGPVRRPCHEDSCERDGRVAARVHLERLAIRLVQPRDDDEFIARGDSAEPGRKRRIDFEPCVRRSLGALSRRFRQGSQRRSHATNRTKDVVRHVTDATSLPPAGSVLTARIVGTAQANSDVTATTAETCTNVIGSLAFRVRTASWTRAA